MADSFYSDDPDRLDYPEADRVVREYLRRNADTQPQTTSVSVLNRSDYPNDHHNRERVHDALSRLCNPTDDNWAGRTVFKIPDDIDTL